MQVKLLVDGGNMKPGPVLGQKLGPLGLNINEIIQKVNEATKNFQGLKVPVELNINSLKEVSIDVLSPPVSELLKKELGIEKGSGEQNKIRVANASIEQIISVAKTKLPNMLCSDLKSAVKTVVGTCISSGILIENKSAKDILKDINRGKYDKEIADEKTQTSEEKKKELGKYFLNIKEEQEKLIKQELAAKEAEEHAKTEEAMQEKTVEKEPEEEKKEDKKKKK